VAYTIPTLSEFRALYPAFDAVADVTVDAWLVKGDTETSTWPDPDRPDAVMLFAAHKMASSGLGTGTVASGVTSFKSGTFSATLSDTAASRTGFESTSYGLDYLALRRRNFVAMTTAWTPPGSICDV
jgi:hypothetical protein